MNRRIVLSRSRIEAVFDEPRKCVVRLSPAYIETADAFDASAPPSGFERDVILEIYEAGPHAVLLNLPAAITTSVLTVDDQSHVDGVPLPTVAGGAVRLRLETANGESLDLRGRGIAAIFYGPRDYGDDAR